jgi:hypothetical protein
MGVLRNGEGVRILRVKVVVVVVVVVVVDEVLLTSIRDG